MTCPQKWEKAGSGTSSPKHKTALPDTLKNQHKTHFPLSTPHSTQTPTQPSPTLPFLLKLTGKAIIFFNLFAFLSPFSSIPFLQCSLGSNFLNILYRNPFIKLLRVTTPCHESFSSFFIFFQYLLNPKYFLFHSLQLLLIK